MRIVSVRATVADMEQLVQFDGAQAVALAQIAIAMLLGGIIGFERERAHKPAGLRTHMLVAGSAALLVILGDTVIARYDKPEFLPGIRADPLRILGAIITGVSFLGAGTIMRRTEKHDVEGLTTAASLLMVAGIGAAIPLLQTLTAIGVTAIVFLTLRALTRIEPRARRSPNGRA